MAADMVDAGRHEAIPVRFGDATRRAVLEELGAAFARAAVVTVGDPGATRTIVALLRQLGPKTRILVRARRVTEIEELERLGADEVIPSEFETAVELFVRLLTHLGVPRHIARIQESIIRTEHYRALRGLGTTDEILGRTKQLVAGGILETARVLEGSLAAGRTLAELDLRTRTGALILSVVRNEQPLPTPGPETRLAAGDLLVLFGPHVAIDRALEVFEPGERARAGG
jgi:CPA2 family monovalent cation:H+ antiporter-2